MAPLWYPENYTIKPVYDGLPIVRVDDAVARTMPPLSQERRWWIKCRDRALAQWAPVGLSFDVHKIRPVNGYRDNRITLALEWVPPAPTQPAWAGFEEPALENMSLYPSGTRNYGTLDGSKGGWLAIDTDYFAWLQTAERYWATQRLTYLIAHEFGHACMGFGHGGEGIMDGTPRPNAKVNAEEIAAARAYWF